MRKRITWAIAMVAGLMCFSAAGARQAVVHGVMFFAPGCGHCHEVMTKDLPPLAKQYGEQLQIAFVNVATLQGGALYKAAVEHFKLPREQQGFPAFILGNKVLVGSADIPKQLPGLIKKYLTDNGVGWPAVPGLAKGAAQLVASADQKEAAVHTKPVLTMGERFRRDPVGNGLAVFVLLGMVCTVGWVKLRLWRAWRSPEQVLPIDVAVSPWRQRTIGALAVAGLGVATYMTYVELTDTAAVCGPVGDCHAVAQSSYAKLFGLPLGIPGMLGYVAVLLTWAWGALCGFAPRTSAATSSPTQRTTLPLWLMFGVASFGTAFSIYLTFLEPFVIGATCAWCLTSAVIMTAIFALSVPLRDFANRVAHRSRSLEGDQGGS